MNRYFEVNDASQPLKLDGFTFNFRQVEFFQGAWYGVLEVETNEQAEVLTSAAGRKAGVRPISGEEYHKKAKKKKTASDGISLIPYRSPSPPPTDPREGRVVADKGRQTDQWEEPVYDGAVSLEDVLTPKGDDGSPEPKVEDGMKPETETQGEADDDENGDTDSESEEDEADRIRAELTDLGVEFHHKLGLKKLREKLEAAKRGTEE
jgi:hypothetical protein